MYRIVRFFYNHPNGTRRRVIKSGLTLDQAQSHCRDPQSSSRTCSGARLSAYTRRNGPWFDGYEET